MDFSYAATPFIAWFVAGSAKFLINSLRARKPAFALIGYGGLPSNHAAVVSSMAALVAMKEGLGSPAFGVAVTVAFIVILDAASLRRHVGKAAEAINRLSVKTESHVPLRERLGHTRKEIAAGIAVGIVVAAVVQSLAA